MKSLMTSSAVFLGALGLAASFLPHELLAHAGVPPDQATVVLVQLAGAAWFGYAMVNWMARGTLIGGIYGRPIALGNFTQFAIGAIALIKMLGGLKAGATFPALAAIYSGFALWFGYALFSGGPAATSRQP
ncbi:MAG: hypothetical protein ABIQ52_18270 [Vicinamibacterales bacterium]